MIVTDWSLLLLWNALHTLMSHPYMPTGSVLSIAYKFYNKAVFKTQLGYRKFELCTLATQRKKFASKDEKHRHHC
jgi:hypothetical protein